MQIVAEARKGLSPSFSHLSPPPSPCLLILFVLLPALFPSLALLLPGANGLHAEINFSV